MKNCWLVRLGRGNTYAQEGIDGNFVGVGFLEERDLSNITGLSFKEFRDSIIEDLKKKNPDKSKVSLGLNAGNLWVVVTGIQQGDLAVVPVGEGHFRICEVTGSYYYAKGKTLPHRRQVQWLGVFSKADISQSLASSIGSIMTAFNLSKHSKELLNLLGDKREMPQVINTDVESMADFGLESHLEDFLIHNWEKTTLGKRYDIYQEEGEIVGQQYITDAGRIDILAKSKDGKEWLIIELKKGRSGDAVVGQLLRYIGFLKENIAEKGETVRGLIITGEDDQNIRYAVSVLDCVEFMTYSVQFSLGKAQ